MHLRSPAGLGLLAVGVLLGLACSGPSSDGSTAPETEERSHVYHVRLNVTENKEKADRTLGRALEWWDAHADALASRPRPAAGDSPVDIVWRPPLYRVQVGPFASRAQADSVLQVVQPAFPGAFVSPERVRAARPK